MRGVVLAVLLSAALAGCGVKVGEIHGADAGRPVDADAAVVVGRVRYIVDGRDDHYTIMNRPLMRLYRRRDGAYYETPTTDAEGRFVWTLPPGEYEIAVLFGGLCPTRQRLIMRNGGGTMQVNGFTYPGYRFTARRGHAVYLGTLVVDVTSRAQRTLISFGERVFGSLNGMRVDDDSGRDANWQRLKARPEAEVGLFEPTGFPVRLLR